MVKPGVWDSRSAWGPGGPGSQGILLNKCAITQVAIRMAHLPEFERSYSHVLLYPPQPAHMVDYDGRKTNFCTRMYGFYLQEMRDTIAAGGVLEESFLVWHRSREYDKSCNGISFRGGRNQQRHHKTLVVACRYWYELTDGYWGQFCVTQIPHFYARCLLPQSYKHLDSMRNFVGMLEYLASWTWGDSVGHILVADGAFSVNALPLVVESDGEVRRYPTSQESGAKVFSTDRAAFDYVLELAKGDLRYRGFRDDRLRTFELKQQANFLLFGKVLSCHDPHRHQW